MARTFTLAGLLPATCLFVLATTAQSQVPSILSRYSPPLFAWLLVDGLLIVLAAVGILRGGAWWVATTILALFVASFAVAANNALLEFGLLIPLVHASRVALGMVLVGFAAARLVEGGRTAARWLLAMGLVVTGLGLFDAGLQGVNALAGDRLSLGNTGFRRPVDLSRIAPNAVVLVGDSFLWGQGVAVDESFASVAKQLLGDAVEVVNLGQVGTGPHEYSQVLKQVSSAQQVVVCLYLNDIPERQTGWVKARQFLYAIGRTSVLARVVADIVSVREVSTVEEYHRRVVADFDPNEPSFEHRWGLLGEQLRELAQTSRAISPSPPLLVILPLMEPFDRYPLDEAHQELTRLGTDSGFEVVDLLEGFRGRFPDAVRYRVTPNDNHFNAEVHRYVGQILADRLRRREAAPTADGGSR